MEQVTFKKEQNCGARGSWFDTVISNSKVYFGFKKNAREKKGVRTETQQFLE